MERVITVGMQSHLTLILTLRAALRFTKLVKWLHHILSYYHTVNIVKKHDTLFLPVVQFIDSNFLRSFTLTTEGEMATVFIIVNSL